MTIQFNIFGQEYDDAEPCFFPVGGNEYYFNRVDGLTYTALSLDDLAAAITYTWGANERGTPSQDYDDGFDYPGEGTGTTPPVIQPPTQSPITATADAVAGTITVAGGPSDGTNSTVTVTYDLDAGGDKTATANVAQGDDADTVAAAIAALTFTGGSAAAVGPVVTITAQSGTITKLTVAVA